MTPTARDRREASSAIASCLAEMDAASTAGDAARFFQSARAALQQRLATRWHVAPASITIAEIDARLNGDGAEIRRIFALADQAAYSGQHLGAADFQQWKEIVRGQLKPYGGIMTLFQILTRRVATGKTKVTRKLLDRVCRETGGKVRAQSRRNRPDESVADSPARSAPRSWRY